MSGDYPYKHHPVSGFDHCWSGDWSVSDPSFIVVSLGHFNPVSSSWSDDGGFTWTRFASIPLDSTDAFTTFGCGNIVVSDPDDIVWAGIAGKGVYQTNDRGATWSAVTLPGVTMSDVNNVSQYIYRKPLAADKATPGTFYLFALNDGYYRSTDAGVTWTQMCDETPFYPGYGGGGNNWSFHVQHKAVPGHAGHVFITPGSLTGTTTQPFLRTLDGGATWDQVHPLLRAVRGFGFGLHATGQTYPAVYVNGLYNGTYGMWRSVDDCATWEGLPDVGTRDFTRQVEGDKHIYGRYYVVTKGSGTLLLDAP